MAGFSAYFFEAKIPLSVMRQFHGLQSNFSFEGISASDKVGLHGSVNQAYRYDMETSIKWQLGYLFLIRGPWW